MTQIVMDRMPVLGSADAASAPARVARTAARAAVDRPAAPVARQMRSQRPARGSGRAAVPLLRPPEAGSARGLGARPVARAHACAMPEPDLAGAPKVAHCSASGWRLTSRGIAVVLVTGLMIMVAALTVVGLTALKVTSAGYQVTVSASLPR